MSTVTGQHGGCYRVSPGDLTATYTPDIPVMLQVATIEPHDLQRAQGIALEVTKRGRAELHMEAGILLLRDEEPLFNMDAP